MGNGVRRTPEEFKDELKELRPELTILTPYSRMDKTIIVSDANGIEYKIRPSCLLLGKTPTIQSAVDPRKAFEIKGRIRCGDKYDYSKVEYKNARKHVTLICPEHGDFEVVPDCHTSRGHGCPICGGLQGIETRKSLPSGFWMVEEWEKESLEV